MMYLFRFDLAVERLVKQAPNLEVVISFWIVAPYHVLYPTEDERNNGHM